jgi:hypothetical protein
MAMPDIFAGRISSTVFAGITARKTVYLTIIMKLSTK